jgi:dTDP-4-dehydrorhamnose reductase
MKKLLITGASGFLGWHLAQIARETYQVYGTYFTHALDIPTLNLIKIDLTDLTKLKQLFQTVKPEAVIHTAAYSQPNYCQTHPEESYSINVTASENIAYLCAEDNIPCIFTSSDLVFDGLNPPYQEKDPVSPLSIYGEHKVIAEQKMLAIYPQTTVCRMPLMFGAATPVANSFMQPVWQMMREGKELSLFTDEFRTPVSANTATKGLLLALEKKVSGVIHLGGKERISRYQFGLLMAEVFNLSTAKITPCLQKDVPMPAPRAADVSLDSSLAFSLGYQPLSMREELVNLRAKI